MFTKNQDLLLSAASHWTAMADFRNRRERCKRYTYGRQWDDTISVDGQTVKEEDYIRSQGNVPLKNNLIRRMLRSVLGVFRNQYEFPSPLQLQLPDSPEADALYAKLKFNAAHNCLEELLARTMEEFLISGLAVHRKAILSPAAKRPAPNFLGTLRTDYVAPDAFFIDTSCRDFRGWDASLIGQLHDIPFPTLCSSFAASPHDVEALSSIYLPEASATVSESTAPFASDIHPARDFLTPSAPHLCRVIEVWSKQLTPRYHIHDSRSGHFSKINACHLHLLGNPLPDFLSAKWFVDEAWHVHFLTPDGTVLYTAESPLPGGGHPYVWKAYPFIDGEIHSFVDDVIDQQRHTNRLITLYDWVLRSTAKGVLLFPENALPEGVEIDDIADQWSRFNGVILFRPKSGMPLPQQVSGNASQVGITELLNIQLKMFEEVSGVSGALEGKLTSGAISGSLYNQQTRQALTALLDILETFNTFIREGLLLDARLLSH